MTRLLTLLLLTACRPPSEAAPRFADPDDWGELAGPGGPTRTFTEADRFAACAYLTGGPEDHEHHNSAAMRDGWLFHPWAPEDGGGGLTVFDVSDPCAPVKVGEGYSPKMRESHTLAFGEVGGRLYLAVDYLEDDGSGDIGGVGFWDVTDVTAPVWVSEVALPKFHYPDAYVNVTLSTTWVGDVVYAPFGGNGVARIDATDPLHPKVLDPIVPDVPVVAGSFHVIGPLGILTAAGTTRVVLFDLSDPSSPAPVPDGVFVAEDRDGREVPYYFSNVGGHYLLLARKAAGGGPIVYDLADPWRPAWVGDGFAPEGDGGYVFLHEDHLFQGESNYGAVYDFADPQAITEVGRVELSGDLDTVTPLGNVMLVSVDDGADPGKATAVMPWADDPDDRGPRLGLTVPRGGELGVRTTAGLGLMFDEAVEARSVFEGSVRVSDLQGSPVAGRYYVQDSVVNFVPDEPWAAGRTVKVAVMAGGVTDLSGNPVEETSEILFSTGGALWR